MASATESAGQRPSEDAAVAHPSRHSLSAPESVPISALSPSDSPRRQPESAARVRELAESTAPVEPIVVHRATMRVIDGMHRLRAAVLRKETRIPVRFFSGDEADAFVLAVELNIRQGLVLSLTERKAAAGRIVDSHPHWSDRAIAERTGLNAKTVAAIRRRASEESGQLHARVGRDGRTRPLNTADGRLSAAAEITANPCASLREIAAKTGISVGTVRDVRKRMQSGETPVPLRQRTGTPRSTKPAAPPSGAPAGRTPDESRSAVRSAVRKLTQDPALRFSEAGRALLRMLHATETEDGKWQRISAVIPPYCVPLVRTIALQRAEEWRAFADMVQGRTNEAI
ncbi:ParB/RepB/Spo0J family partition protein [Streptomyces sp. NPDC001135]